MVSFINLERNYSQALMFMSLKKSLLIKKNPGPKCLKVLCSTFDKNSLISYLITLICPHLAKKLISKNASKRSSIMKTEDCFHRRVLVPLLSLLLITCKSNKFDSLLFLKNKSFSSNHFQK